MLVLLKLLPVQRREFTANSSLVSSDLALRAKCMELRTDTSSVTDALTIEAWIDDEELSRGELISDFLSNLVPSDWTLQCVLGVEASSTSCAAGDTNEGVLN